MQDDAILMTPQTTRPRRSVSGQFMVALLAFMLGASLVGWLGWRGYLSQWFSATAPDAASSAMVLDDGSLLEGNGAATPGNADAMTDQQRTAVGTLESRLAMLEDRLSRIDYQADIASGSSARSEGLLIAFAARRMVERGEPLRYIADQLRLRFSDAQPRAVQTVIDFSNQPVTVDELSARLDALAPDLSNEKHEESLWTQIRRELGGLFVVRNDTSSLVTPPARIERAKLMLTSRRIGPAIAEVERLPGADAAKKWISDAHRFEAVQQALDLLETTAMLEPNRLKDASGKAVDQPSPLISAPTGTASAVPEK